MRTIVLIILISIISCKSQQKAHKEMTTFNIEKFNKENKYGQYGYFLKDSTFVSQTKTNDGYFEYITPKNSYIQTYRGYYQNGLLEIEGKNLLNNDVNLGLWKYYDKNGNLTEEIDYDAPFIKYPWEKVLGFLKQNEIDIKDDYTVINRDIIEKENAEGILKGYEGKGMWYLSWVKGIYIYSAIINAENGKIKKTKTEHEEGS